MGEEIENDDVNIDNIDKNDNVIIDISAEEQFIGCLPGCRKDFVYNHAWPLPVLVT